MYKPCSSNVIKKWRYCSLPSRDVSDTPRLRLRGRVVECLSGVWLCDAGQWVGQSKGTMALVSATTQSETKFRQA